MKSYSELEEENAWLRGCLRESRKEKRDILRSNYMFALLFGVASIFLALTWAGVIVI